MIERTDRFPGKVRSDTALFVANRDIHRATRSPKTVKMSALDTVPRSEYAYTPTYDTVAIYSAGQLGAQARRWPARANAASHTGLLAVLGTLAARPEDEQPEFVFIHVSRAGTVANLRMTYAVVPGLIFIGGHILADVQAGKTTDVLFDTLTRALAEYADGERGRMASAFRRLALKTNMRTVDT